MSKPTNKPGWNPTNATEPSASKKAQGWAAGEKPAAEHFNWLMKTVSEWIEHVDADQVKGEPGDQGPQGAAGFFSAAAPQIETRLSALEDLVGATASASVSVDLPHKTAVPDGEYDAGAVLPATTKTINWAVGSSQLLYLDGDCLVNFSGLTSAKLHYLRVRQSGAKSISWVPSIVWDNNSPTLDLGKDRVTLFAFKLENGAVRGRSIVGGFAPSISGSDSQRGYIVGGLSAGQYQSAGSHITSIERINFSSDQTLSLIQRSFGLEYSSSAGRIGPGPLSGGNGYDYLYAHCGMGTQSITHGYRMAIAYTSALGAASQPSLQPGGTATSTERVHKLSFADETSHSAGFNPNRTILYSNGVNGSNNTNGVYTITDYRRGVVENSTACYLKGTASSGQQYSKMQFSTDAGSTVSVTSGMASGVGFGVANTYYGGVGYSSESSGTIYGLSGGVAGESIAFSTETPSSISQAFTTAIYAGEGVNTSLAAYAQATSSTTGSGTSTLYKGVKNTHVWSVSSTGTGAGTNASASQGNEAGYFSGGMNWTGNPATANSASTNAGSSNIHRIIFSSDTYSLHNAQLNTARIVAAGFEG